MYRPLGPIGYFGCTMDIEANERANKANKLVDEYNSKINTFETKKENDRFAGQMVKKINETLEICKTNKSEHVEWEKEFEDFIFTTDMISGVTYSYLGKNNLSRIIEKYLGTNWETEKKVEVKIKVKDGAVLIERIK